MSGRPRLQVSPDATFIQPLFIFLPENKNQTVVVAQCKKNLKMLKKWGRI
jgi:hypothetical protein